MVRKASRPPAALATAEMYTAVRNPDESSVGVSAAAPVSPDASGRTATAKSEAARATVLLTADAMPECSAGAALIAVAVSGATVTASPAPNTSTAGRTWVA